MFRSFLVLDELFKFLWNGISLMNPCNYISGITCVEDLYYSFLHFIYLIICILIVGPILFFKITLILMVDLVKLRELFFL